jgi:2-oxoglutarate ferredoxin oxidoreductase subunit gamma
MTQQRIISSGFGGQGVITIGNLIATLAMEHGLEVSFMPSYGPEMRGGTANCHVIIDQQPIGSPIITSNIDYLIAMNEPSLTKFLPLMRSKGTIILNATLVKQSIDRSDVRVLAYDFGDLANQIGNMKVQNMLVLGLLCKELKFELQSIKQLVEYKLKDKPEYKDINNQALEQGYSLSQ